MGECPLCGQSTQKASARLIKDACGHMKCRMCLLQEENGCRVCKEASLDNSPHKISSIGNFDFTLPETNTIGSPNYENPNCTPIQLDFNKIPDNYGYDCISPIKNPVVNGNNVQNVIENHNKETKSEVKTVNSQADTNTFLPPLPAKVNYQLNNAPIILANNSPNKPQSIILPTNEALKVPQNLVSNINKPSSNLMLILLTPVQKKLPTNENEVAKIMPQIQNSSISLPNTLGMPFGFINNGTNNLKHSNNLLIINNKSVVNTTQECITNINQRNVATINQGNLTHINQGNFTNINQGNFTNINQENLTNVNHENRTNINQGNLVSINQGNLPNLNPENLPNLNQGNLTNINQGNIANTSLENVLVESLTESINCNDLSETFNQPNESPDYRLKDYLVVRSRSERQPDDVIGSPLPYLNNKCQSERLPNEPFGDSLRYFEKEPHDLSEDDILNDTNPEEELSDFLLFKNKSTTASDTEKSSNECENNGQLNSNIHEPIKKDINNIESSKPTVQVNTDGSTVENKSLDIGNRLNGQEDNKLELKANKKVTKNDENKENKEKLEEKKVEIRVLQNVVIKRGRKPKPKIIDSEIVGHSYGHMTLKRKKIKDSTDNLEMSELSSQNVPIDKHAVPVSHNDSINGMDSNKKNDAPVALGRGKRKKMPKVLLYEDDTIQLENKVKPKRNYIVKPKRTNADWSHIIRQPEMSTYKCTVCNKIFRKLRNRAYHAVCRTDVTPSLRCESCDRTFASRSHYEYHQRVHENNKPFSCDHCGKSFVQKSKLNRHLIVHLENLTVECGECGKKFSSKLYLKSHIKYLHRENPKRFQCKFCPKSYAAKTNKARHEKSHTTDRPYKCTHCPKSFTVKFLLSRHLQRHEKNNKTFRCDCCNQMFLTKFEIRRHMPAHLDEKPHTCEYCCENFSRLDNLKRHIKHHHSDDFIDEHITSDLPALTKSVTTDKVKENNDQKEQPTQVQSSLQIEKEKLPKKKEQTKGERLADEQTSSQEVESIAGQISLQEQKYVEEILPNEEEHIKKKTLSQEQETFHKKLSPLEETQVNKEISPTKKKKVEEQTPSQKMVDGDIEASPETHRGNEKKTASQEQKSVDEQLRLQEKEPVIEQILSTKENHVEPISSPEEKQSEKEIPSPKQEQAKKQIQSTDKVQFLEPSQIENPLPVKRKRGRPRKYAIIDSKLVEKNIPAKRGRPKKYDSDGNLIYRKKLVVVPPPAIISRPERRKRGSRSTSTSSTISSKSSKSNQSSTNLYQSPRYERSNAVPVIRGPIKLKRFAEDVPEARPGPFQQIPREAVLVLNREFEEKASCSYPGLSRLISAPPTFSSRRRNSNGNNTHSNDSVNSEKSKTGDSSKEGENEGEKNFPLRKDVDVHWRRRTAERLKPRLAKH